MAALTWKMKMAFVSGEAGAGDAQAAPPVRTSIRVITTRAP
jgi:hypothetical protein